MKFKILFFSFSASLLIAACSFNKKVESTGELFLQGTWREDTIANEQLVSYQKFNFQFRCDSFYLTINNFSTANLQGGPCYDKNTWSEYAKGYYQVINDTLRFDGNLVDKQFKYKTQGSCYRSGKFTDSFLINNLGDSVLVLKSLQTGTSHRLLLIEKSECK